MNQSIILLIIIGIGLLNLLFLCFLLFRRDKNGSEGAVLRLSQELFDRQSVQLEQFRSSLESRFDALEHKSVENARTLDARNGQFSQLVDTRLEALRRSVDEHLTSSLSLRFDAMEARIANLYAMVDQKLETIRKDNASDLEKMRQTVDEKLQSTLESRLSQSFAQVSKQLESVYKGLGEMQNLAKNVGDLSRLFTNVKSRGVWGEVQVQSILDEILTPEQYETNFAPKRNSQQRVEFAIKLPGKGEGEAVYLPIDSKFPREDYERYVMAEQNEDMAEIQASLKALRLRVLSEAQDIASKYLNPPRTTDFAILFLPTESLYAEVLRMAGFTDELQTRYRVVVSGPTTLSALLNSLQMGFKTLQVEKRSSEVWRLFASMRKQFELFSRDLSVAQRSLETASGKLGSVSDRSQKIGVKLASVELPETEEEPNAPLELPLTYENV